MPTSSPEFRAAAERFRTFFEELGRVFVERDDLLTQIALALLGREHVLMTGPPGTAKSGIAAAVLGRIIDERTGKPSLFARQFTESTVQTDLVGPIDFKTLMQTGRTEHFTDEGMLGAVHAFLDEVLDGRDMLLRATLNVLQERELKQGTRTTVGHIECALMTTNRYLAEVLEGSRETLLAFVDRIAFVSFVPKGFAAKDSLERVLRSQIGGARPRSLKAHLTIQDLDVLQAAVERVVVPDEMCTSLCTLLDRMDVDLAAAAKGDPTFLPTRYLSTRTAVRAGKILRSAAVYDIVMRGTERELEADHGDLAMLRLTLLLCGPAHAQLTSLLDRETDPRERRQLSIQRTEREIFDRALARIPKPAARAPRKATNVEAIQREVEAAMGQPTPLVAAATKLAAAADAGGADAVAAAELLATTLSHLAERALRDGSTAGAGPDERALDPVARIAELAAGLERASGETRPVARWLRGRAIHMLLDSAAIAGASSGKALDASLSTAQNPDTLVENAERTVVALEMVLEACARLRAAGAEEPPPNTFEEAVLRAVSCVEGELVEIWDAGFKNSVAAALERIDQSDLATVLKAIAPSLALIEAYDDRLVKLGGKAGSLKARVAGPRILPLVRAAFERAPGKDRLKFVEQVGGLVSQLGKSGLDRAIPAGDLLRHAMTALVRAESSADKRPAAGAEPRHHEGYRALRAGEQRVTLAYTIVELALLVSQDKTLAHRSPEVLVRVLTDILATVPAALREQIIALDLARIERSVGYVEGWWETLAEVAKRSDGGGAAGTMGRTLQFLAESKFFHVTRDEEALLRFALECRVLGEVFPEARDRALELRARIERLEAASSQVLNAVRRGRADAGWTELLGPASSKAS